MTHSIFLYQKDPRDWFQENNSWFPDRRRTTVSLRSGQSQLSEKYNFLSSVKKHPKRLKSPLLSTWIIVSPAGSESDVLAVTQMCILSIWGSLHFHVHHLSFTVGLDNQQYKVTVQRPMKIMEGDGHCISLQEVAQRQPSFLDSLYSSPIKTETMFTAGMSLLSSQYSAPAPPAVCLRSAQRQQTDISAALHAEFRSTLHVLHSTFLAMRWWKETDRS